MAKEPCDEIKTECALEINNLRHQVQTMMEKFEDFKNIIIEKILDSQNLRFTALENQQRKNQDRIDKLEDQYQKLIRKLLTIFGGATVLLFLLQFFAPALLKGLFGG